jgi:hypothetical protein
MSALFLEVFATAMILIMLVTVTLMSVSLILALRLGRRRLTMLPGERRANPDFSRLGSGNFTISRIGRAKMEISVRILIIQ